MNQISCDVCRDLIPLVKDGIASEESSKLVMEHIKTCESCAGAFGRKPGVNPEMDDRVVLKKIKKQLVLFLLSVILAGALMGMVLSDGMGMFYNALIMPIIGGFGYMLLREKAFYVPLGMFLFSFIWVSIRESIKGFLSYSTVGNLCLMSIWWSAIFAFLIAVGVLIAWLLHYAFKKEG